MISFDMTARRRANGLGEAQRGAQQLDLVEEQLLVAIRAEVGPALVASGEDHRAHRVPRLLEPAHDLQVARLVAHDPEVPKLLLQALRDGHDLFRGLQETGPLPEPLERPRGLVHVQQVGVSEGFHFSLGGLSGPGERVTDTGPSPSWRLRPNSSCDGSSRSPREATLGHWRFPSPGSEGRR